MHVCVFVCVLCLGSGAVISSGLWEESRHAQPTILKLSKELKMYI